MSQKDWGSSFEGKEYLVSFSLKGPRKSRGKKKSERKKVLQVENFSGKGQVKGGGVPYYKTIQRGFSVMGGEHSREVGGKQEDRSKLEEWRRAFELLGKGCVKRVRREASPRAGSRLKCMERGGKLEQGERLEASTELHHTIQQVAHFGGCIERLNNNTEVLGKGMTRDSLRSTLTLRSISREEGAVNFSGKGNAFAAEREGRRSFLEKKKRNWKGGGSFHQRGDKNVDRCLRSSTQVTRRGVFKLLGTGDLARLGEGKAEKGGQ